MSTRPPDQSQLTWPEQNHTSPKATSVRVRVVLAPVLGTVLVTSTLKPAPTWSWGSVPASILPSHEPSSLVTSSTR